MPVESLNLLQRLFKQTTVLIRISMTTGKLMLWHTRHK